MPAKEKRVAPTVRYQWPVLVDARAMRMLETDTDVQYLVIPVRNRSGRKPDAQLPDEKGVEDKTNAFLASLGLSNAFASVKEGEVKATPDAKQDAAFDIFAGFEEYRAENNQRKENLRNQIVAETEWLDASQLSDAVGFENKNRSAGPNTWKRRNKIFAISWRGKNLYPRYCLDDAYQPLPVVKEILDIFGDEKSGWSLAYWFSSGNSWLGGQEPRDLLTRDKGQVIRAALAAKDGIQHG
ncbi:hypothetical protein AAGR22_13835 [Erwinia sp. HDF1-3R]|uniref:hypothetical protein n=1 Tax=Erwinia sp. HDF1-3R TaxID=3141543 RepID=UPI0031F507F4